jgi:hypothetical protein
MYETGPEHLHPIVRICFASSRNIRKDAAADRPWSFLPSLPLLLAKTCTRSFSTRLMSAPHLQPVHGFDKVLSLQALEEAAELCFVKTLRRHATQVHIPVQDDDCAKSLFKDFLIAHPACLLA